MSLQDVTDVSDLPRNSSQGREESRSWYRFRHDGSLHDRLLTATIVLVLAVGFTAIALFLPYGRFLGVLFAGWIAAVSTFEVVRLFARDRMTTAYRPLWGVVLFCVLFLPSLGALSGAVDGVLGGEISILPTYLATVCSAVLLMVLLVFEGRFDLRRAEGFGSGLVVSFLLIGCCVPMLILLSGVQGAVLLLWWLIGVVALNDSAAYFVGRACGKTKLAPDLSPKKTVEGSLAGLGVGTLAGIFLWGALVDFSVSSLMVASLSFVVVLSAQFGDLGKSYLKRVRGVKDFGALLPGHGGVLDRFDALITAAPILFCVFAAMGLVTCR